MPESFFVYFVANKGELVFVNYEIFLFLTLNIWKTNLKCRGGFMQTKRLRRIIFTLLFGIISVAAFGNSIDAQNPESRRRENKEKKKDEKEKEQKAEKTKLMQEWFSSPENRKKILEERARKAQEEDEKKKAELERAKRRGERQRRDFRRDDFFDDDDFCEEISDQTETEFLYSPKETYADFYKELQATAVERGSYLREQNRLTLFEYQKEYLARLEGDNLLSKQWKSSAKNQGKDYRYVSRGTVRRTSQAGTEMIYRAINNGYERGIFIGHTDRKDNWKHDPENSYVYQDAIYGYDGYEIDLAEYRFYFQQGFWRGYEDGFYKRFVYGKEEKDKLTVLETVILKIVEFKS